MPTLTLPLTTYSIRQQKPNNKFGSTSALPLRQGGAGTCWALARVALDRVPVDGVITSAKIRFYANRNMAGSTTLRVLPITSPWNSSVTWTKRPSYGDVIDSVEVSAPRQRALFELDVTSWAANPATVNRGLLFTTLGSLLKFVNGSAAGWSKPDMVVEYVTVADQPGNLIPDGGAVSVAQPILTYAGDEDMTDQRIQFSTEGTLATVTYDSGFIPATTGRFNPATAPGSPPVLTDGGSSIYWRVQTRGPESGGDSAWSQWAEYRYVSLEDPVITNPPATTDDGTPPLTWTASSQTSFLAIAYSGSTELGRSGWTNEPGTRDWTSPRGVKVPNGRGRFLLRVRDSVTPRVAAEGAPTYGEAQVTFTTTDVGSGAGVDTLTVEFEDPIPVLTGTRGEGTPDLVGLFRDGVQVPLWTEDGTPMRWAPGIEFFDGSSFRIRDYTSNPRTAHTWNVRTKTGSTLSVKGPTARAKPWTKSVWLVNPRTDERVEITGPGEGPVVEQVTEEGSIVHTPVHGGLIVEPVRRRLMRTTRQGTISGSIFNDDEDILTEWVEGNSGEKYRLIFGKVNWSVIIGDYSPSDEFYGDNCGPNHLMVAMNWWERLADY